MWTIALEPGVVNRERDFYLINHWCRVFILFLVVGIHPLQIGGRRLRIENFARNQAKNLHRRGSQAQGLLEVKGGPRSQETKTVTDKISTRRKDK